MKKNENLLNLEWLFSITFWIILPIFLSTAGTPFCPFSFTSSVLIFYASGWESVGRLVYFGGYQIGLTDKHVKFVNSKKY